MVSLLEPQRSRDSAQPHHALRRRWPQYRPQPRCLHRGREYAEGSSPAPKGQHAPSVPRRGIQHPEQDELPKRQFRRGKLRLRPDSKYVSREAGTTRPEGILLAKQTYRVGGLDLDRIEGHVKSFHGLIGITGVILADVSPVARAASGYFATDRNIVNFV